MEQLADTGNGNYAYIDTLNEAQKVLVDERHSTLQTIARDVKIQVEFNPATVAEYRLIGYENRALKREDFNNDKVDAGEIGAGHSVTALYEVVLTDSSYRQLDKLRYQSDSQSKDENKSSEVALLRLRYKQPGGSKSTLIEHIIEKSDITQSVQQTSNAFQFAAAVAAFGQQLRGGKYTQSFTMSDTLNLARGARGKDPFGYRGEFLRLVNLAQSLSQNKAVAAKR
jgi:Ca-activated chloride channel family protein